MTGFKFERFNQENNLVPFRLYKLSHFVPQHLKELRWSSTWLLLIHPSITISSIIQSTCKVNLPILYGLFCLLDFNFVMRFLSLLSFKLAGTKHVIDACVELKIKRLIYTSSPSVVFDGVHGILNGDESLPYPPKVLTWLEVHGIENYPITSKCLPILLIT